MNPVVPFEIPAADVGRARRFHADTLGRQHFRDPDGDVLGLRQWAAR